MTSSILSDDSGLELRGAGQRLSGCLRGGSGSLERQGRLFV